MSLPGRSHGVGRSIFGRIALAGRAVAAGGVVGDELGEVLQQMLGAADAVLGA
jgi:hypothetical protein